MKVLFVNSCPRGEDSRTLALARTFLDALGDAEIICHDLPAMALPPIDSALLDRREALCNAHAWEAPFLRPAVDFVQADMIVIAAPYWDLSFPSMLKVWVEHMWVRNLTFHYENDRCVGHARAKQCIYVTTSGSPIGANDWGTGYISAVMDALGVGAFRALKAEALDLDTSDPAAILAKAKEQAIRLAGEIAGA